MIHTLLWQPCFYHDFFRKPKVYDVAHILHHTKPKVVEQLLNK